MYGKRALESSQDEVDKYWRWHKLSESSSTGPMGLDGIFVDEVDCDGENLQYFESLSRHIKAKIWRSGTPGTFFDFLLTKDMSSSIRDVPRVITVTTELRTQ